MNALQKLDNATRMLAEVRTAKDAKQVMDIAAAAKHYAKKHKLGKDAVAHAHAIQVDACAMLGEFLRKEPPQAGARGYGKSEIPKGNFTLKEINVTPKESSAAQLLATVKDEQPEVFEKIRNEQKPILQVKRER